MALMKELEETRKVVEEAKKIFQSGQRNPDDTGIKINPLF